MSEYVKSISTLVALACATLAPLWCESTASAQLVPTAVTLSPSADSTVDRLFDTATGGSRKQLPANAYFKPEGERALFKFDQTQIKNAIGTRNFVRARLVLQMAVPAWSFGASYVDAFRLTANWSESTVTWRSLFGSVDNFAATPTTRVVVPDAFQGTVEFDVSKDVAAFLAGTPNYGWVIKDDGWDSGVSAEYYSKESTVGRPVLVVESTDALRVGTATVTYPEDGTISVDTTNGSDVIELPDHGKSFSNLASAISWSVTNLHAIVDRNSSGAAIGVFGESRQIGTLYQIDAAGNVSEIEDIVSALLGGKDGIMTVAGTQYCVRPEICGEAFKMPNDVDRRCNASGTYCAKGTSWNTKPASRLWIYSSIGTKLEQKEGGWHKDCGFCWKGPIPWRCCKTRGSNTLRLVNFYRFIDDGGNPGTAVFESSKNNTDVVKNRMYAVFSSEIHLGNNGKPVGGSGSPAAGQPTDGVCGAGQASGTNGSASTLSAAGKAAGPCEDD